MDFSPDFDASVVLYRDLNHIGQSFVRDPYIYTPADLAIREEIAAPVKLRCACNSQPDDWRIYRLPGNRELYAATFRSSAAIEAEALSDELPATIRQASFTILTQNPAMFHSARLVPRKDTVAIIEWFQQWRYTFFVVLNSVYAYESTTAHYFAMSVGPEPKCQLLRTHFDIIDQIIGMNGYTIGDTMTLLLAMERSGTWSSRTVLRAFHQEPDLFFPNVMPIPPEIMPLFLQAPFPTVWDYPYIYASSGRRPSSPAIREYLRVRSEEIVLQWIHPTTQLGSARLIATAESAAHPFLTPDRFVPDDEISLLDIGIYHQIQFLEPEDPPEDTILLGDYGGWFQSVFRNRTMWNWWRTQCNGPRRLAYFLESQTEANPQFFGCLFRRLFHFYQEERGRRVRQTRIMEMIQDLTAAVLNIRNKKTLVGWVVKYLMVHFMRGVIRQNTAIVQSFGAPIRYLWSPAMPVAFMKWLLHSGIIDFYAPIVFKVHTNMGDLFQAHFSEVIIDRLDRGAAPAAATPAPDTTSRYTFTVRCSFYKVLQRFGTNAPGCPESRFYKWLNRRAAGRLYYLKEIVGNSRRLSEHSAATVLCLMREHFIHHRMELVN